MAKRKAQIDWVFMGPDPYLATCARCGEHIDKPKMPLPVSAFVKYSDYTLELHRYCKDVPERAEALNVKMISK